MASYTQKTVRKSMYWHKHRHGGGHISPVLLHQDRKRPKSQTVWVGSMSELFGRKI